MRTIARSIQLAAIATLAVGSALAAQDGDAQEEGSEDSRTTAHGVYNDEQAGRGEDVFWNICSECHFEDDFGGPFLQSWEGASVKDLLEEIKATMPEDNPGGLPDTQYLDIITYVFKINGLPTGDAELSTEEMDAVDIEYAPGQGIAALETRRALARLKAFDRR